MDDELHRARRANSVAPSYAPGHCLYSTSDCLTANDIDNYFRIGTVRSSSTMNAADERKSVEYLRATSFDQQKKAMEQSNSNGIGVIPHATFSEK
jgi:hypothetical protein